ncbi:hypothetical protein FisN_20Hh193 [Fistulifera solaris]|uniref:SET domain-containing protein n=1 Tax=Fistulifera solaris TaxID=1519565 RepID=A0A1Z5JJJ9_FISSO|nr:hypothetical protein FisN_20Hh193 [Fistulifera solaris]|eukprot:GAX14185.1 hypothetical protein FisN_20Hh193 [Fistulifera solaris]
MPRRILTSLLLYHIHVLLLNRVSIAESNHETTCIVLENGEQECTASLHDECTLYMAESTIPGAGLGIFTGIPRHKDEIVWPGDVMYPVVDLQYHMRVWGSHHRWLSNPLKDYVWFGPEMGMQQESSYPYVAPEYVTAFCPGMDAAINCNLALLNVEKGTPNYDTTGLHRSKDPGAGAFTPYHQCETIATHDIPAGGELFKFYGDWWFESRPEVFDLIPLSEDYYIAEELVEAYNSLITNMQSQVEGWNTEMSQDLWGLVTNHAFPSRTLNALPRTSNELETVIQNGIRALYQPQATRSIQELNEHGRCVDQMIIRASTVPQAGRGAFARRFLPQGSVVASTPLMFFPNDYLMLMYEGSWFEKDTQPNPNKVEHHQIFYNYCWNHPESSIFLCPYGIGVNYINHGKNGTAANARLQWAKDGEMRHNDEVLQSHPRKMLNIASPRLYMDIVATRDIQPGEEIFFDYGEAWQSAWDQHVAKFESVKHQYSSDYQSARDWNTENHDAILRTEEEQQTDPYPSHFELKCIVREGPPDLVAAIWNQENVPAKPCRIIGRGETENGDVRYKVVYKDIRTSQDDASKQTIRSVKQLKWSEPKWLHRVALRFMDRAYTNDLWLPHAFRHPIGIPDDIFPHAWRGIFFSSQDLMDYYETNSYEYDDDD